MKMKKEHKKILGIGMVLLGLVLFFGGIPLGSTTPSETEKKFCLDECGINDVPNMECQPQMCYALYDPVCGSDGKTHSNNCVACKSGVEWYSRGECNLPTSKCQLDGGICVDTVTCPEGYKSTAPSAYGCSFNCCLPKIPKQCEWCGQSCVEFPMIETVMCPHVMPPEGYSCVFKDGKCQAIPTNGECQTNKDCQDKYQTCHSVCSYGKCYPTGLGIDTYPNCCSSICKAIGTKSEGWYDSCTEELIKYENCGTTSVCQTDRNCWDKYRSCYYKCMEEKCVGIVTIAPLPDYPNCEGGTDCKKFYWFDNIKKVVGIVTIAPLPECEQKQFCGNFMYEGLKTFNTQEECLKAVRGEDKCEDYGFLSYALPPTEYDCKEVHLEFADKNCWRCDKIQPRPSPTEQNKLIGGGLIIFGIILLV